MNPAIPIFYGTFALIFTVAIHETMHGIIARKHGLPVKSVGVLFLVIPAGAFVEPEEQAMLAADPVVRRRVIAGGPAINLFMAIALFLILVFLMMPSVHPIDQGMYVQQVDQTSPTTSLISPGSEIIAFGNYTGSNLVNDLSTSTIAPGTMINTTVRTGQSVQSGLVPAGLVVDSTLAGYPANKSNIAIGGIIAGVNGITIYNQTSLTNVLDGVSPGSNVSVSMLYLDASHSLITKNYTVTTASKYSYYQQYAPGYNSPSYKNQSFLGVTTSYLGVGGYSMQFAQTTVFGADALYGGVSGALTTISLPFEGLSPVPAAMASLYTTPFSAPVFWFLTNLFFWVFWISLLLGLMNALPLFITDGSQFLRDTLVIWGKKRQTSRLSDERKASAVANILGLIVVFLVVWEIVLTRIL